MFYTAVVFAWFAVLFAGLMPFLYSSGFDITRLYYGTDTRIFSLFAGAALGFWRVESRGNKATVLQAILFWLSLACICVAYVVLEGQSDILYLGGMAGITLVFCLQIAWVTNSANSIGSSSAFAPLRWCGRHSYGIFLWQYPGLFILEGTKLVPEPYAPYVTIATILLLTIWSDVLIRSIEKVFSDEHDLTWARTFRYAPFLTISIFFFFLMGGGVFSLMQADAQPKTNTQLRQEMEQKAAEQAKANEEARQAEILRKQQAIASIEISGVACIGDSVMLGSSGELRKTLKNPYIDAEVSRYVGGGLDAAKLMQANGTLGNVVVIALGTNGPIAGYEKYEAQTRALLDFLKDKQIFWVNVYCPKLSWQDTNNAYIQKIAQEHPNITVIDWYGLISQHPDWLTKDGVHPNVTGTKAYAKLVHDAIASKMVTQ